LVIKNLVSKTLFNSFLYFFVFAETVEPVSLLLFQD